MPLTRVNGEDGRKLAERIRGLGLSNRQMGELYACYRAAAAAVRRRIVEDPALFLKARSAAKEARAEAGLDEKQQRCVKSLELIGNVSLGLARGLPDALNYDTPLAARGRIRQAWTACRERFDLLGKVAAGLMREEGGHAGQTDTGGDIDVGGQRP